MADTLTIPARFRGPPNSGNGGYVAGVAAQALLGEADAGAVQVTLRAPIPLDTPLTVIRDGTGQLRLVREEQLIVEAERAVLNLEIPTPPEFAATLAAREASPSFYRDVNPLIPGGTGFHPVCVCCGADVAPDQGLHVYAAPVTGFDGVAAAWRPHPALADQNGNLAVPTVWTALDCPGQFAYLVSGIRTGLLGRMTARILRPVPGDADLQVIGWCMNIERRKHFAGTALFDAGGKTLFAFAHQTWIGVME